MEFVIGIVIGLAVGWNCGTWSENRLWLNAICGREKIWKAASRKDEQ